MAEYNKKWADLFPATIGNQMRPSAGVDNTLQYETDKFPQHIANDPVRYDKMNAVVSQAMSNDERLNEKIKRTSDDLAAHNKDPKAHATGIAGNAATATKVVTTAANGASANIAEATMASNDLARIRVSGANNSGELALETADDGSEPIVARQYTGVYANVVRTAKILDEGGNTSFPGTVVAPKFTGSLNGNAATATKLATARTISLTGNASGNATFDGSGNTNINTTVNAINNQGKKTAIKDGTAEPSGLKLYEVYNNGYPTSYGNLISIGGLGGGELLAGWSGTNHGIEHLYYRNRRDNGGLWSNWSTILDSENYNSFAPTKTGGGASGNWGINISGNADSATKIVNNGNRNDIEDGVKPPSGLSVYQCYTGTGYPQQYGNVVSIGGLGDNELFLGWGEDARLLFRAKRDTQNNWMNWHAIAFTDEINNYAPTKTGGGASGTWGINISGTATKLATARNISLTGDAAGSATFDGSGDVSISTTVNKSKHAVNADSATKIVNNGNRNDIEDGVKPPSGLSVYQCYTGTGYPQQYGNVVSIGGLGDNELFLGWGEDARLLFRAKRDTQNNWMNWHAIAFTDEINNYAPTKTGGGASGTWGINISGNAARATNADKVDGYHASDLLRILGGNRTPVITDIFDRTGTIDMSTMSAADKATHKANINKASNGIQNIWNNSTGIHAYGGDLDIAGYHRGALKLTQSYKNFDKILVFGTNDEGDEVIPRLYDVWELTYAFSHSFRFQLIFEDDIYWSLYGSVRTGTDTDYVLSTDTVWNCRDQNCGIIAIYGIKY